MKSNDLFTTPEEINAAVANFKTLKRTVGWQLVAQIFEANIKELERQILQGFEGETKEQIDRKRDKLTAYREVLDAPDYWIKKLQTPAMMEQEDDPYHTVESYRKEKKTD